MKIQTLRKTCGLITGLFIACAFASAQVAPPTPAQAAGPGYSANKDISLVMPKTTGPNFYLEGGMAWLHADIDGSENFFGPTFVFGWRINQNNKIQVETAALFASHDNGGGHHHGGYGYGYDEKFTAVPMLASYSYCIPLDARGKWEIRLTPTAGLFHMKYEIEHDWLGSDDDTDTSFAWGLGVGVTCHLNKHIYIDFGYRYLRVDATEYGYYGDYAEIDPLNTQSLTASFGWKF